ncbi:PIN and XPG domain-containing protein [Aspergillus saccharolyticus JOP 1030-1]|uniref:Asteroid domain-containing protein n=1 Tax=Aspergillus saccharolyticus JOP 1030-1 TaxID=1450539 RepID=A0A318Z641_9EURO|nr:hypothetical protein BP01DRAFT_308789 [Aspergillus saccharolyticus JOP 1030-1]PYH40233.1 hypothetical protein BP01DRAFT_308789 [Aspergillus saccharolyticus JOP 1030-1]
MGILRLKYHLDPYLERVSLQNENRPAQGLPNVQSVVIDGPSLVYHIHHRLLSWSHPELRYPDVQPTCDEVSHGVMTFLLNLAFLGVKIEKICFDGALPPSKQTTRLARLEKSRRRLGSFRTSQLGCSLASSMSAKVRFESFENILQSRSLPPNFTLVPENPFIVPTVYEDLRQRWTKEKILQTVPVPSWMSMVADRLEFVSWADITIMVPGEADCYCAYVAKQTGCSILTSDSDLLLYDIGSSGSIVFLNSINCERTESESRTTAQRLCPMTVAKQLGLSTLLPLAFELNLRPRAGLNELIRRSKVIDKANDPASDFSHFTREYLISPNIRIDQVEQQYPQSLDTRVSEVVSQYILRETYLHKRSLNMYLVMLNEDPKRQCAWMQGRLFRAMGYSFFNLTQAPHKRHDFIIEHIRRGDRITADLITLKNRPWVRSEMQSLLNQLDVVRLKTGMEIDCPLYWRTFALYTILGTQTGIQNLKPAQLEQFLTCGYMDNMLNWEDVHTSAQMQSVLYSLRILKQLIEISETPDKETTQICAFLAHLPSLHVLTRSTHEMRAEYAMSISAKNVIERSVLFLWNNSNDEAEDIEEPQMMSDNTQSQRFEDRGATHRQRMPIKRKRRENSYNIFEILSQQ